MNNLDQQFAAEVREGLSAPDKFLSSKWFYDEKGDQLFVQIMALPEYYLTRSEAEIFSSQTSALVEALAAGLSSFDLIELGAGDGSKTLHLLKALAPSSFTYRPIDISEHALINLRERIHDVLPQVDVQPLRGEYFQVLEALPRDRPKVILFMGSNIGNLLDHRANDFLKQLSAVMNKGDRLLLGLDLKKAKDVVLPAYNDATGVTAAFNLNVLHRINRELGGDFDTDKFLHAPEYDEDEGIARSYIQSTADQKVYIKSLDLAIRFREGERIFTEISRKYDSKTIEVITDHTDLDLRMKLFDKAHYFCDAVFEKV